MHVTFLVPPGHGHLNPTLGVAAELVERGHRVTYPVPATLTGAIEAVGAEPVLYDPPMHRLSGPPRHLTGSFLATFQLLLLEALAMAPVLEKRVAGNPPDLISFDSMGPYAARVLSQLCCLCSPGDRSALAYSTVMEFSADFGEL